MANKFTYHHATSEVVQVATITEPLIHPSDCEPGSLPYKASFTTWEFYNDYLSSLPRYAARGFAPEDDGKEFEEGVGFKLLPHPKCDDFFCAEPGCWTKVAFRIPDKVESIVCPHTKLNCNTGLCNSGICSILEVMKHEGGQPFNISTQQEGPVNFYPPEFVEWAAINYNFIEADKKWAAISFEESSLYTTSQLYSGPYQEYWYFKVHKTKANEK